jgi:quinohemoprotein ethanol dehydrogenase
MFAHFCLMHSRRRAIGTSTKLNDRRRRPSTWLFIAIAAYALIAAMSDPRPSVAAQNDHLHRREAGTDATQWTENGRTAAGEFFSSLHQIDVTSAPRIGFAWQFKTGTFRGMEGTPLVVDGVMYVPGIWGFVYALDARTGRSLWSFDPQTDRQFGRWGGNDVSTRGLAVLGGKVYAIATDCRLFALDAKTGRIVWVANTLERQEPGYACNGAPQIAGKVVTIGNVGSDNGKGGTRGYVSAYYLDSGRLAWRFYTVPSLKDKNPSPELARAAATWDPNRDPSFGGGGTVWGLMSYDSALDLLYFGTGNAAPYDAPRDWSGGTSTDRLYAASIIAVKASTGRMRWYYQTTPGDVWDFDAAANVILTDLPIKGRTRQVLIQANKNGYFYVIDRATGEPLLAEPFAYMNWSTGMSPVFRPVVTRDGEWGAGPKIVYPSVQGAHSWPPMSYSPATKLVYVPTIEMPNMLFNLSKMPDTKVHGMDAGFDTGYIFPEKGLSYETLEALFGPLPRFPLSTPDGKRPMVRSILKAIDPRSGQVVWQQPTSQDYFVIDGGVLSTEGGLVFAGREDGKFVVYDASSGHVLKEFETGSPIMAAPMTYEVDGRQYVGVLCGHGGSFFPFTGTAALKYINEDRVLVFALDGSQDVPKPARRQLEPYREPPARSGTPEQIAAGKALFVQWCSRCHSLGVPAMSPDLSRLGDGISSPDTFKAIVRGGAFVPLGMPRFDDALSDQDASAIHDYLIDQAWDACRKQQETQSAPAVRASCGKIDGDSH